MLDCFHETKLNKGGQFAEDLFEQLCILKKINYKNVTDDKEYQKSDIDFVLLDYNKTIEIKADGKTYSTKRVYFQTNTHVKNETDANELYEKMMKSDYICLNTFINDFGNYGYVGCNIKSKSDYLIYFPIIKKENNSFSLIKEFLPFKINNSILKNFKFFKKDVFITKPTKCCDNDVVYYSIGFCVDYNKLFELGLALELK